MSLFLISKFPTNLGNKKAVAKFSTTPFYVAFREVHFVLCKYGGNCQNVMVFISVSLGVAQTLES